MADKREETNIVGAAVENKFRELDIDTKSGSHLLNLTSSQSFRRDPCDLLETMKCEWQPSWLAIVQSILIQI